MCMHQLGAVIQNEIFVQQCSYILLPYNQSGTLGQLKVTVFLYKRLLNVILTFQSCVRTLSDSILIKACFQYISFKHLLLAYSCCIFIFIECNFVFAFQYDRQLWSGLLMFSPRSQVTNCFFMRGYVSQLKHNIILILSHLLNDRF